MSSGQNNPKVNVGMWLFKIAILKKELLMPCLRTTALKKVEPPKKNCVWTNFTRMNMRLVKCAFSAQAICR